ncbi:hypothetical protein DL96DRAFT_1703579 [Flagelloscypha sp. PMI_526]|nr:hypothetical protein DL96DRAFT_1703579 [Flagelloscypha sp. PMI_526]
MLLKGSPLSKLTAQPCNFSQQLEGFQVTAPTEFPTPGKYCLEFFIGSQEKPVEVRNWTWEKGSNFTRLYGLNGVDFKDSMEVDATTEVGWKLTHKTNNFLLKFILAPRTLVLFRLPLKEALDRGGFLPPGPSYQPRIQVLVTESDK